MSISFPVQFLTRYSNRFASRIGEWLSHQIRSKKWDERRVSPGELYAMEFKISVTMRMSVKDPGPVMHHISSGEYFLTRSTKIPGTISKSLPVFFISWESITVRFSESMIRQCIDVQIGLTKSIFIEVKIKYHDTRGPPECVELRQLANYRYPL